MPLPYHSRGMYRNHTQELRNTGENEAMTPEEVLISMKNFFENIDKLKTDLEQEIKRVELERDDLLHELELGNLNAVELTKVAVVLRDVMKERRKYKDELARVMTLKGFTDKYNNKLIIGDILQVLKNLKTLESNNEKRHYTPRVIKDLKCTEVKDE